MLGDDNDILRFQRFITTGSLITKHGLDSSETFEISRIFKAIKQGIEFHVMVEMSIPPDKAGKYCKWSAIQSKCKQFSKGCSFATKWLKNERNGKSKWDGALAWHTWRNTHRINLTKSQWGRALNLVYKSKIPVRMNWNSFTTFTRTCWTKKKNSLALAMMRIVSVHCVKNQCRTQCTCTTCVR